MNVWVLFGPPGPAAAGRVGLYILLLYFITFFDTGTYRWESAQQAPADTIPTVGPPAELIKYPQTFDPSCPPFLKRGKCPNFGPNFDPSRLWTAVFLNWGALSENKNKLVKDRWQPYHHTKLPEPVAQLVPQMVKVENFLYILHSSGPRQVQHHQCYTTCWGCSLSLIHISEPTRPY